MGDKDFFLSPDDAQTMGDINYMRTSKRTRRTFPKTLKNPDGFAIENEVSATEDRSGMFKDNNSNANNGVTFANPTPTFQTQSSPAPTSEVKSESQAAPIPEQRRKTDTSMDMFRNMAKKIRK